MEINKIEIVGIGGIRNLTLKFKGGLNLICGSNGVGKTTILECIAAAFTNSTLDNIKKNVLVKAGACSIYLKDDSGEDQVAYYTIKHSEPIVQENHDLPSQYLGLAKSIFIIRQFRQFDYIQLRSIERDPIYNAQDQIIVPIDSNNMKNWFINRFMFSGLENTLTEEQISNFNTAKKCFSILDREIEFAKVLADTFDIILKTPQGDIYFEYLSSGYKSCLSILLGIIKEVEFRFKSPYIKVEDFSGIILIDEIDLHLHPKWQATLIKSLKKLVPKAQIFATTHSPSMVQSAEPNEVIPLELDDTNNVAVRKVTSGEYGFQGWTVEEILTDVMGMENTKSNLYTDTIEKYDRALDHDDINTAKECYKLLEEMLHPQNPMRKLLKLQMIGHENDDQIRKM